jgi:hypothetical protein
LDVFFWQTLLKQPDKEIAGEGHTSATSEGQVDKGRDATVAGGGGTASVDRGVATSSTNLERTSTDQGDTPQPAGNDNAVKV